MQHLHARQTREAVNSKMLLTGKAVPTSWQEKDDLKCPGGKVGIDEEKELCFG